MTSAAAAGRSVERIDVWAVAILTLVGAALRIPGLDSSLWYDEINPLVSSIRLPLRELVTSFPGNNDHMLYSLLAHVSVGIFGESPWTVRLPAMLFGVASIPMLYVFGRAITGRGEALMATAILTVSYHHVWFSQNARGYTVLMFFVLMATFLLVEWLRRADGASRGLLVAYALAAALGSYTHLTMVFVVVSHALVCAWLAFGPGVPAGRRPAWQPLVALFVGSGLLTIAFYAPVLLDVQGFFTDIPTAAKVATPLWALLAALRGLELGFGTRWVLAAGAFIGLAGVLSYWRRSPAVLWLLVLPAPVTLITALALGRPVFPRFVFFLMGFGLLIAIRGAAACGDAIGRRLPGTPAFVGLAMASLLTAVAVGQSVRSLPYGYAYPKQAYGAAAELVEASRQEGEPVAVYGITGSIPFIDYMGKPWLRVDDREALDALRGRPPIWFVYTMASYMETRTPDLWALVQAECEDLEKLHGTVAGGDIHVARCFASESQEPSG